MTVNNFTELNVWKESITLVKNIYILTKKLPKDELYGISSQMRRAAVSIPSNIAEGQRKHSRNDFIRFLNIAIGSAGELETQLIIVSEIYSLDVTHNLTHLEVITKMLFALRKSLELKT